jgi:hypothetical protein
VSAGGSLAVNAGSPSLVRSCWGDYVELPRPRLSVMVLFTVADVEKAGADWILIRQRSQPCNSE